VVCSYPDGLIALAKTSHQVVAEKDLPDPIMSMRPQLPRSSSAIVALMLCLMSGCRMYKVEECCPTDLRHTYSVFNNEAVRHLPCGPDEYDYGTKPTLWRSGGFSWSAEPIPVPLGQHSVDPFDFPAGGARIPANAPSRVP